VKPQSRRSFLRSGTLAALAAGCALVTPHLTFAQDRKRPTHGADYDLPSEIARSPVFHYTQATFEPFVGGIFLGRGGGRTVNLELLSVKGHLPPKGAPRSRHKAGRATRGFTLTFRADAPLSEITTIHPLEHAALGRFDLFLTRRGEDEEGRIIYEAVFNHFE
jgi:hypothetical protein